jgi:thiol:disulfide interchange protein DsbC
VKTTWIMLPLVLTVSTSVGDETAPTKEDIAAKLNGVSASDITESPIEGLYQVSAGSNIAYVTADGRFLIQGELYDLESRENMTEATRATARIELLGTVDPGEMIVFSPEGETKHTVTIFTDIDCGYCRQFHSDIEQVNALGIEVHYLFYPRTGPDTESWAKAEKVWCAKDRNSALTRAKAGGAVPDAECATTPVAAHFELGQQVGVRGTPSMYAANGELLGGYLPPETLFETLEDLGN